MQELLYHDPVMNVNTATPKRIPVISWNLLKKDLVRRKIKALKSLKPA